ncbi:MAG TPA: hypothetical protein VE093_45155 [Polyangiaceae bacterium]|nr:hypothetical protein [Polyangiaceae bacterium]
MVALALVSACGLATEGELYEEGASRTDMSASSGQGPGGGASSTQGAGGGGTGGVGVGGAGGVGGGAAGGGGVSQEVCFDGVDNDKDGDIDCADSEDCAVVAECVPALPAGFLGYVRYHAEGYTGAPITPPPCPDGSPPVGYLAGPGGPATCSACTCDWPGAACSAPKIDCHKDTLTCNSAAPQSYTAMDENCIGMDNFNEFNQDESCAIVGPAMVKSQGMCTVSGGAATKGLMWQEEIFVCALGSAPEGCMGGQVCAPKPAVNYEGALCIHAPGDVDCPNGWKTEQRVVYSGGNDARGCSMCGCQTGVSCANDGYYTAFDSSTCSGGSAVVNGGCTGDVTPYLGGQGSLKPKVASVVEGQCGGGEPTGEVVTTGAVTICCR